MKPAEGWIYCTKDSNGSFPAEGRWSSEGTSDPNGARGPGRVRTSGGVGAFGEEGSNWKQFDRCSMMFMSCGRRAQLCDFNMLCIKRA